MPAAPELWKDEQIAATAFSLLVFTKQPLQRRLFLKKSRTSPSCPVQSRSENALEVETNLRREGPRGHIVSPAERRQKIVKRILVCQVHAR